MTHHVVDHISRNVSDYEHAKALYAKVLAPLGFSLVMEVTKKMTGVFAQAGFGGGGKAFFWLSLSPRRLQTPPVHIAFGAESRTAAGAFYHAALEAGGTDNGAPGMRAHNHPNDHGAFVLDADGHNFEAVCHMAEPERAS